MYPEREPERRATAVRSRVCLECLSARSRLVVCRSTRSIHAVVSQRSPMGDLSSKGERKHEFHLEFHEIDRACMHFSSEICAQTRGGLGELATTSVG